MNSYRERLKYFAEKMLGIRFLRAIKYGVRLVPGEFGNVKEVINSVIEICYKADKADSDQYWLGRLRQSAHILDKALHVKDFEPGRSRRYYEMAQYAVSQISGEKGKNDPSFFWALNCIAEYESKQIDNRLLVGKPYERTTCSYEDVRDVILKRRSIRQYKDEVLGEETLRKIVEVIDWSPTSCNRQSARVFVANELATVRECMKSSVGATCFSDNVSAYFVFCADLRSYDMPAEFFNPFIDVSLGIQNCNLVACSLGVSITMLSWASHNQEGEARLRRLLQIPDYCQIIVNAVAGYPDVSGSTPQRKNQDLTFSLSSG